MQCKLCLKERPLIKKSHIIPRQFFHEVSKNIGKGFGDVSHGDTVGRIYSKKTKSKQVPSGIHVPNILCEECEQKLGVFDNYAQTVLLKGKFIKNDENTLWKLPTVDYKKLKLFFLSILWRSHICNNPFFKEVSLTESLESELRKIIIREEPGDENNFPIFLRKYKGIAAGLFYVLKKQEPFENYHFRIETYEIFIKMDDKNIEDNYKKMLLTPNSPLVIPVEENETSIEYKKLLKVINEFKE